MNPARSAQRTGCLPAARATWATVAVTSSAVRTVGTISTSRITWAGLNQCIPTTSWGREVAVAHSITGREDVVVAMIAPGRMTASISANSARLTARSSTTASMTRSQSASAERSVVPRTRASVAARSSEEIRPLATPLSRERSRFLRTPASFSSPRARKITS